MMRILLISLVVILIACNNSSPEVRVNNVEESSSFDQLKVNFIDTLWRLNPIWASYEGFHNYDSLLPVKDEAYKQAQLDFSKSYLEKLKSIDADRLKEGDRIDFFLIRDYLKSIDFYQNEFRSYEWDPSTYNIGGAFFQVLNYKEKNLAQRLEAISKKLDHVPAYYKQALKNLNNPTQVHTELAIQQLEGAKQIFNASILDSLNASSLSESSKSSIKLKLELAINAIDEFKDHLESKFLPLAIEGGRNFRIGKELYEKKFGFQIQSSYSAEEIFKKAIGEKQKLHDNLYRLSEMLWEDYFGDKEKPGNRLGQIRMVIDEVSKQHVHRDSFITSIRNQIPELERFVRKHDLLTLDLEKPLIVRETPKYMQGIAGASISAPGPYDKNAETFYNVTPLDDYTDEEAESYLREYNNYTLQILNIHEAVPGHYTQLIYSNKSPSLIKSILGNGAMIEGWAVYTEKMMLENDFGGDNMEMGLMYYKWNLRTVCNTILDYGVHVLGFTEEEAMQLLMKEAFQEKAEADGKWRRVNLSQVQLCSYFTGYSEIMELREEIKMNKGDNFSLKAFHEEFLSFGSAPVKYIREIMLAETHSESASDS